MNPDKELLTLKMQVKAFQSKDIWGSSMIKKFISLLGLLTSSVIYLQFLSQEHLLVGALLFTFTTVVISAVINRVGFKLWKKKNE